MEPRSGWISVIGSLECVICVKAFLGREKMVEKMITKANSLWQLLRGEITDK